jgi:hypothetical protein
MEVRSGEVSQILKIQDSNFHEFSGPNVSGIITADHAGYKITEVSHKSLLLLQLRKDIVFRDLKLSERLYYLENGKLLEGDSVLCKGDHFVRFCCRLRGGSKEYVLEKMEYKFISARQASVDVKVAYNSYWENGRYVLARKVMNEKGYKEYLNNLDDMDGAYMYCLLSERNVGKPLNCDVIFSDLISIRHEMQIMIGNCDTILNRWERTKPIPVYSHDYCEDDSDPVLEDILSFDNLRRNVITLFMINEANNIGNRYRGKYDYLRKKGIVDCDRYRYVGKYGESVNDSLVNFHMVKNFNYEMFGCAE